MAIDVSSLAIQVKSEGIDSAAKQLDNLASSAKRAEDAVGPLVASTNKLNTAQKGSTSSSASATTAAEKYIQRLKIKAETLGKTQAQTEALKATERGFTAEQVKQATAYGAAIDKQRIALEAADKKGSLFNNTVRSMVSAFILYKAVDFGKSILQAGDSWQMMTSRLKVATGSMKEAVDVQGRLFDLSQKLRAPLEDSTRLYTRLVVPMQKLGKTSAEVMQTVEGVGLALALNGSTGAEASSVMLQFSQSMAAGRLNGAELNAVLEGAPPIIRAIEAELTRTGKGFAQTGKTIKQMGADGELGVELITQAINNAIPKWRKDFEELPITVDGAMTLIRNAWVKTMGEMSRDTDLNKNFSKALLSIIDIMPMVRDAMASAIIFITENIKTLTVVIQTLLSIKLVSYLTSAATAFAGVATGATAAGTAVTGIAATLLRFTGWVGIAVTVLGSLYTAYKLWADNAPKQSDAVNKAVIPDTNERIAAIIKETEAINERYAAASREVPKQTATSVAEDATVIANNQTILKLKEAQNSATNQAAKDAIGIAIQQKEADNARLTAWININKATKEADAQQKKTADEEAKLNEYRKKYDKEYQRQAELKAAAETLSGKRLEEAQKLINAQYDKASTSKATSALKAQEKAVGSLSDALKEQAEIQDRIKLFGNDYDKLGEGTKKRITLERQLNSVLTDKERSYLQAQLLEAKALEQSEALTESMKKQAKATDELNKARSVQEADLAITKANYAAQLETMKLGDKAAANQEKIFEINKKYSEQRQRLDNENAASTVPNYSERMALINAGNEQELRLYEDYYAKRTAMESDWQVGAEKAWNDYKDSATNVAELTRSAFTNTFASLEDALLQFVTTGKVNFKSLATSILQELAKIAVKAAASGIFQMIGNAFVGSFSGGASTPAVSGSGFSSGGMQIPVFGSAMGNAFDAGGVTRFANGGSFANNIVSKPTKFNIGEMGEAGPEAIVPLTRTSDGSLGVKQVGGGSTTGGDVVIHQEFNISSDGSSSEKTDAKTDNRFAKEFADKMAQIARLEIQRQQQQGGSLWRMRNGG